MQELRLSHQSDLLMVADPLGIGIKTFTSSSFRTVFKWQAAGSLARTNESYNL